MGQLTIDDLSPNLKESILSFLGTLPATGPQPNSVVVRDSSGSVHTYSLYVHGETTEETSGAIAYRASDGKIEFCHDMVAVRKYLGISKVFWSDAEPDRPNIGDIWIGGD